MRVKVISSLEKVLLSDSFEKFTPVETLCAARGERVSFQLVVEDPVGAGRVHAVWLSLRSKLRVQGFDVGYVPAQMPVYQERCSGE